MACATLVADCTVIGYLIDKINHGTPEYTHPIGASFSEVVGMTAFNYATVVDPICRPITSMDVTAVIESININPVSPANAAGTKADLSISFKATDGNCHTIKLANMKRGTLSGDMRSMPYTKSIDFLLEGVTPNLTYT